ncbi:hypothetical protein [Streptomyces sp. NPDC090025]|uniref:hypothetical protein n=1 Tax=Streptomyces sp. NPDC090025 TaxID=3365922 RepID=UPI003838FCF4
MATEPVPRREVVTRRPDSGPAPVPYRPQAEPSDDLPPAARAHVRTLIRAQLRAALLTGGALVLFVGTLPLVFRLLPGGGHGTVAPVVVWAVLGGAVYPLFLVLARWYVRRAERNEDDYRRAAAEGS